MTTRGNAVAGSLAASLQAAEISKLLAGERASLAAGCEVLVDAASYAVVRSRLVPSRTCRFSHERWEIEEAAAVTLREALALGGDGATLGVPDAAFVSRLDCAVCGLREEIWRLEAPAAQGAGRCPRCGAERSIRGFDLVERLSKAYVPAPLLDRPLEERGLRAGDVFAVETGEAARHFVLASRANAYGDGRVVIAGLGNIGSFLAPLVARMPAAKHVVLCDPDAYEAHQVAGQDVDAAAAGASKAHVQADRLRAIRPELRVEPIVGLAEELPLGVLRGAVTASCLDSRGARRRLAARAWRAGSAFVDAAVGGGESLLVRTSVYLPEADAACFECGFDENDYAALDQVAPCAGARAA